MLLYQLISARKALDKVSNITGADFAYAIFKNKQLIDNQLINLEFIKNISSEVIEYEDKRVKLCEEFSEKDENGNPIIENDLYLIKDRGTFKEKADELFMKYKPFIEERQQQIELFNSKMNQEIFLNFIKLKKEQLPDNFTAKDLDDLFFMIE